MKKWQRLARLNKCSGLMPVEQVEKVSAFDWGQIIYEQSRYLDNWLCHYVLPPVMKGMTKAEKQAFWKGYKE